MPAVLAEISPYDPVAGATVTLRVSTDDDARVCALNGQPWWPVLMKAGKASATSFDASFPGFAATPTDRIEIDLSAFPDSARYSWGDRPVRLWLGEPGQAWPWTLDFQGLVAAAAIKDGRIALTIRPDDAWLDRPVLGTYAGTGGLEGPAALAGAAKPLALGQPKYLAPVQIDTVQNVWQWHGAGAAGGVIAALDRLVRYPPSLGDDATLAALIAATIPPGSYRTCNAQGLVRFGAPPAGPLTLIVNGGVWDSVQPRRAGALIRRIALLAGATPDQIDAASLAALDAGAPYNISLYQAEQITARDLIARIAASMNGLARISLLGKLEVILPEIGTPVLTLAADGSAEPQVLPLELLETGAPTWRLQMAGNPCWRVHGAGEYYEPPAGADGADGVDGVDGADGKLIEFVWKRAATAPATPTGNGVPAGWSDDPPTGSAPLWMSKAKQELDGTLVAGESWSAPIRHDGPPGADGADGVDGVSAFTAWLTRPTVTLACDSSGALRPGELAKASGQMRGSYAGADVTASCTFSKIAESSLISGAISSGGAYSLLSIGSVESGVITFRASYDPPGSDPAVSQDIDFVITKAPRGAAAIRAMDDDPAVPTTSMAGISDILIMPVANGTVISISAYAGYIGTGSSGTCNVRLKAVWRYAGDASWTDASAYVEGVASYWDALDSAWYGGMCSYSTTLGGFTTDDVIEIRLEGQRLGQPISAPSFSGNIVAERTA
jgi:hypothetical protein